MGCCQAKQRRQNHCDGPEIHQHLHAVGVFTDNHGEKLKRGNQKQQPGTIEGRDNQYRHHRSGVFGDLD